MDVAFAEPVRRRSVVPDSKRLHRALFGVHYEEDIFDRLCAHLPRAMRLFKNRIPGAMLARDLIFIHVPRVAGTSIARALYGPCATHHYSIRYYRTVNPAFYARVDSFALLRDPFDRFASAYAFVRRGGTATCRLSDVFAAATTHVRSVDDYLSFLEERDMPDLDFVMRPQSWFVCDLQTGKPLVKSLFLYQGPRLADYLRGHGVTQLPWLNPSDRMPMILSGKQRARIERLYAQDFALVESLKQQHAREAEARAHAFSIAAE